MRRISAALALAVLAACGTPQEQCIARNTRELRTIDRLIAETQGNLDRGYALERITITEDYWETCFSETVVDGQPVLKPRACLEQRRVTVERPAAIDPAAEARKLEGLKAKRRDLARQAEPLIAQCKADYPE